MTRWLITNNNKLTLIKMEGINYEAFRKGLPIYEYYDTIVNAVKNNDYLIVTGDTGSGKSTQLPQYMMDSDVVR